MKPAPKFELVPVRRVFCLCGCGKPVGEGFYSYASTDCLFRGRQR